MDMDYTRKFSLAYDKDEEIKAVLTAVYNALQEKGYNPINQIVGYILSEDPTYITNYNNARTLIRKIDRDELLQTLLKSYLSEERQDTKILRAHEHGGFFTFLFISCRT